MTRRDDFTATPDAAAAYEAANAYPETRTERAEAAGYDPADETIGQRVEASPEVKAAVRRAYDAVAELRGWGV